MLTRSRTMAALEAVGEIARMERVSDTPRPTTAVDRAESRSHNTVPLSHIRSTMSDGVSPSPKWGGGVAGLPPPLNSPLEPHRFFRWQSSVQTRRKFTKVLSLEADFEVKKCTKPYFSCGSDHARRCSPNPL